MAGEQYVIRNSEIGEPKLWVLPVAVPHLARLMGDWEYVPADAPLLSRIGCPDLGEGIVARNQVFQARLKHLRMLPWSSGEFMLELQTGNGYIAGNSLVKQRDEPFSEVRDFYEPAIRKAREAYAAMPERDREARQRARFLQNHSAATLVNEAYKRKKSIENIESTLDLMLGCYKGVRVTEINGITPEVMTRSIRALFVAAEYGIISEATKGLVLSENPSYFSVATRPGIPTMRQAYQAFETLPADHPLKRNVDVEKANRLYNGLGPLADKLNYMGLVASIPL